MSNTTLLDVHNLTTSFYTQDGIVKAVDSVSYNVARGETIALVGESGCGKTVSALSILRLIPDPPGKIVSGQVLFAGTDLLKLATEEMRQVRGAKISMIFQEPMTALNPVLTIGRQISETLELHQQMPPPEAHEEAIRLLKMVGIPDPERRVDDYPHRFSGGMRQRAMIAMSLVLDPTLILADEPTTGLDVIVQDQILSRIKEIHEKLKKTMLLITHNMAVVAENCDKIAVMYAGKIMEYGREGVFHHPYHPYTLGLINAFPALVETGEELISIPGSPPDLLQPPAPDPGRELLVAVQAVGDARDRHAVDVADLGVEIDAVRELRKVFAEPLRGSHQSRQFCLSSW